MKSKLGIATGAAIISFTLIGAAADQPVNRSATTLEQRAQINRTERIIAPAKANDIIGKEVVNPQNEKLGKVGELIVDVEAGRVALVVVSSGGVLGVGAKNIAVPPQSLTLDAPRKALRLDVDKEKFKNAPTFDMTKWEAGSTSNQLAETYRYYGREMYVTTPGGSVTARVTADRPAMASSGHTEKASKVIGMSVVNKENKKCGDVDNLIVDLPSGRIIHVVVSSGGFLGVGDALNAIPPTRFQYVASRDALQIDLTKEDLTRAPNFKSTDWPDFTDAEYSAKVYRSYNVEPYFDADNTKRNVRDRQPDSVTPLDQGSSEADLQTTRRIRQEIMAREGLSLNARNVKVITANGRVTLRGPVKSETEKQTIADIAARIAQPDKVDNQLEITTEPNREP
jgi:sporulation protein YlmC with PRC-barrel domain